MSIVTMKEMLEDARNNHYAVGAFDVSNYEMIRSVVDVAEEEKAPVILSALKVDIEGKGLDYFMAMAKTAAENAKVPVAIHLDHATDFDLIRRTIEYGFSSVMYDGSVLPFEENIQNTKQVCEYAHSHGVTVEAELGHVADAIAGNSDAVQSVQDVEEKVSDGLTKPEDVEIFLDQTGVDALAVAIGTAHGVYISKPVLDFERLKQINAVSRVPLVLHGGSGTPDADIQKAISLGICKINIFSEVLAAFHTELKETLLSLSNMSAWPSVVYQKPVEKMRDKIREKIQLFHSNNRA